MKTYARRFVIGRGVQAISAALLLPLVTRRAGAAEACVKPASESLLKSLNYVPVAADAAKSCKACAFFTADAASAACGGCMIASGPVNATGHCDSWVAKT